MLSLCAHLPRLLDGHVLRQKHRRRIAVARGLHQLQAVDQRFVHLPQRERQIVFLFRDKAVGITVFLDSQRQPSPKLRHEVCVHGQASRLFMSAEAHKQILAGTEHSVDIHAGNGAAGAHGGIAVAAEDNGRPMVALADAPRRQSDHAAVPVIAHDDNSPVRIKIRGLPHFQQRLLGDLLLHALAHAVILFQMGGDTLRRFLIGSGEQLHALTGFLQPSARVQPRCKAEAHMSRVHGRSDVADGHKRPKARTPGIRHAFQSQLDNDAILIHQRHDVRHGGKCSQLQPFFHALHALHGLADFERHTRAAQAAKGIVPQ